MEGCAFLGACFEWSTQSDCLKNCALAVQAMSDYPRLHPNQWLLAIGSLRINSLGVFEFTLCEASFLQTECLPGSKSDLSIFVL